MGRGARGVRGMTLADGDYITGAAVVRENAMLLSITENGYGKRTEVEEYRIQSRGGKGIKAMNLTEKTGKLAAQLLVHDEEDLLLITQSGTMIRTAVDAIRTAGRATQGVRIINLRDGDSIASVMAVPVSEDEEVATDAIVAEGAEAAPAEATAEAVVEAPQTEVNE